MINDNLPLKTGKNSNSGLQIYGAGIVQGLDG